MPSRFRCWLFVIVTACLCVGLATRVDADDQEFLVTEVPLNLKGRHPIISATFLGKAHSFVFDTGAATTIVDREFRSQLGTPLVVPAEYQEMARRVDREVFGKRVISLNGQRFYSDIGIDALDLIDGMFGTEVAGIIGIDCFEDYVMEFDPDDEVFRVYDHLPARIREASEAFPIVTRERDNRCWVELPLPNVGTETLLIDTGDDGSVRLREETFDRLVQSQNIADCFLMRTMGGDGFAEVVAGMLNEFNAGRFHHDHLNVDRSRKSSGNSTLGWSYLRRYITVVDLVQHRLYLRPSKYFDAPELLDKSGLEFFIHKGEMIVANSAVDSPAHHAGLKPFDTIVRVNGKPVAYYTLRALQELMCQVGEVVNIEATSRSGTLVNAEFRLREFRKFSLDVLEPHEAKLLAELPVRTDCSAPLITANCFGREQTMLLDTRSRPTVFREGLRSALGEPKDVRKVKGPGGSVDTAIYDGTEIHLADYSFRATNVLCADLPYSREVYGVEIDGIIGMQSFQNLVLELDLAQKKVRIYDHVPKDVIASSVLFPMSNASKRIAVTASIPEIGFEDFAISTVQPGSINLQKDSFQKLAAIGGLRKQSTASRCFSDQRVFGNLKSKLMTSATIDTFRLGQFEHQNLTIDEDDHSAICHDYLERFIVVIDLSGKSVYLRPSIHYESPESSKDGSGLFLFLREGRIFVEAYEEGSPAEEAGLKLGDEILSVNDKPAQDYALYELRELLKRHGETAKLVVRRGEDDPFTVEFTLKDFRKYLPDAKVNTAGDVEFNP